MTLILIFGLINTNYLIWEGFYDKTFRNLICLEFSSGHVGSKIKSVRPFWKILAFDHIWTWAWPPLWPWGSWPMAPSLFQLIAYQTTFVPILVLSSKSAQSISLSALLFVVLQYYGVTRFFKLYVTKAALLGSVKVVFKLFTSHLDNLQ